MKPQMLDQVEEQILASYESMYRMALTYVKNQEDAMDVVQESTYKAIKNASSVKNAEYIKTWLFRIVMNTSLDLLRKRQKEVAVDEFYEAGTEDSYTDFDTINALNSLDEKERAVIVLRFFEDRKIQDVASILDENVNTVKSILYRSLRKLKIKLAEGEILYDV